MFMKSLAYGLIGAVVLSGAAMLSPSVASAQTAEEKAGARAAAESGGAAFEAGRYEEAVDYFSRAEEIIHALPHLLYIARSYEKLGRLVAAREAYLRIDQEELPANANPFFRDAKKMAAAELDALEPRIPYISVVVQGAGNEPVKVIRDGQEMARALVGIPQPTDPGEHSFQALAPGMESSLQKVTVTEGSKETVLLTLRQGGGLPPAGATPTSSSGSSSGAESSGAVGTDDQSGPNWFKIGGFTAIGVGGAAVIGGTVLAILGPANSQSRADADAIYDDCGPENCTEAQQREIERLDSEANGEWVPGAIIGGVGLAAVTAGIILLIVDDSDDKPQTAEASVRPWVGLGSVGLSGTF